MLNEPNFFWKNFRLGDELQIAGSFIYNAIYKFEEMETFEVADCFEFLYNIAVGFERLQKVVIILIEHNELTSQNEFEKSLITHNNLELLHRIKKCRPIHLGKQHIKFLALLDDFYRSARYDRFNLNSVYHPQQDQQGLIKFLSEALKIEIRTDFPYAQGVTENIKKFISNIIEKLTTQLYDLVRTESTRLGTYTNEIAYNSKAFKIFIAGEFSFKKEKLMQREVCLYLLKTAASGSFKNYLDAIEPLEFGQLHTNFYFQSMFDCLKDRSATDEMEYLYEENNIKYSRAEEVLILGSDTNFDMMDDVDGWEEEY